MPQGPFIPKDVPATAPKVGQRVGDRDAEWNAATPLSTSDWDAAQPIETSRGAAPNASSSLYDPTQPVRRATSAEMGDAMSMMAGARAAGPILRGVKSIASSTFTPKQVATGFYDLATGTPEMKSVPLGTVPSMIKGAAGAVGNAAKTYGPTVLKEGARAALPTAVATALIRMLGGR